MAALGRKVVARHMDGRLVKGYTFDFSPSQPRFHVFGAAAAGGPSRLVLVRELKALFFVRDLAGDPARQDRKRFLPGELPTGRPVEVVFHDGEVLVGGVDDAAGDQQGFFLAPADRGSNNLRVYVVRAAARAIRPVSVAATSPRAVGTGRHRAASSAPLPRRLLAWLTS
jgi:hypothetical protein